MSILKNSFYLSRDCRQWIKYSILIPSPIIKFLIYRKINPQKKISNPKQVVFQNEFGKLKIKKIYDMKQNVFIFEINDKHKSLKGTT